ncbi:Crp/Fnr family transcriptional regulator [Niastella yeongjuensis]|uniref:Crp/Fnr family transcriptional regulator n=1 Tax=Niastella yeongjuensis TaxID=354355 RepID=A0A1V9EPT8_9BACT|nr:Crp/Fnr family transcriptional regulator [Niastella yeongjuensis]OQP48101.1 Crp/Fnr family transcriptional regulator [Niastella yeongjuensis]SEO26710.1 cAMP-binding domain of CRP or a regulatory subunit of cAMP-dependent protein kinases [Niastella yeongjuensis]
MSIRGIFPIDNWNFQSESILTDLPPEDFALLTAHKTEQLYSKGEIIFREAAYPAGIFYIIEGKVKKYKVDKEGRVHIIYVANQGDIIGYHAILSEDRYPDSAAALEKSKIAFIPKEDFLITIQQSPVLNKRLLKTLSHEFAVLANSISVFAQKSVRERLALQLIVLREKYKVNFQPGMPVEINISRDDLANIVGTARERAVRILTEFKEAGILETKGRTIIVHDVNQLIKIANYK